MGKTLVTLVLLTLPSMALAATSNNTIKFQGEVAEQTCMVDINGTARACPENCVNAYIPIAC